MNATARTIYRGALRAAKRLEAAESLASAALATTISPACASVLGSTYSSSPSNRLAKSVTAAFRGAAATGGLLGDGGLLLDAALSFIALANARATTLTSEHYTPKPAEAVAFSVGQIVRHASGWRGVVVGYDLTCEAGPQWIAAAPAEVAKGTAQPFYHVLPDMRSAAGLSRAAAESMGLMPWLTRPRYVAQSSLAAEATSGTAQDDGAFSGDHDVGLVVHPLLGRYFSCYRTDTRRFVPNKALEALYPDDAFATSIANRAADLLSVRETTAAAAATKMGRGLGLALRQPPSRVIAFSAPTDAADALLDDATTMETTPRMPRSAAASR